jgi:hypothetical protein
MGATLLNYLNRPNGRKHGIGIQGEAIVRGEHTLYLIMEATDAARVREFMQPFAMAGTMDVYPAGTCAGVVSSGGCGAARPDLDPTVPALDPEEACQPQRRRRAHPGRKPLPENLPRVEEVVKCTEETCRCCGAATTVIGYDESEHLDVEPARYFVRVSKREKRACHACQQGTVTMPPLASRRQITKKVKRSQVV